MSTATAAAPTTMTAAEFLRDYGDSTGVELVNGILQRNAMPGFEHDSIETNTAAMLHEFVKRNKLGRVVSGETFIRLRSNPNTIRAADVTYISYERLPKDQPKPKGPLEVPPEMVVEIRSPTDRLKDLVDKAHEYFSAGVVVVLIVDPTVESIGLFRDNELPIRFHNGDTVTIPDLLPGFAVPVKSFFE